MRLDLRSAIIATIVGLALSGVTIVVFDHMGPRVFEILFALPIGVAVGAFYGFLAERHGADHDTRQSAKGGALCTLLPVAAVWLSAFGPIGLVAAVVIAPGLGACGGALHSISL